MSTWVGLYRLLELAGVDRGQFFFTNAYVGLKEGTPTGRFKAYDAPEYRRWCRDFLAVQVQTYEASGRAGPWRASVPGHRRGR